MINQINTFRAEYDSGVVLGFVFLCGNQWYYSALSLRNKLFIFISLLKVTLPAGKHFYYEMVKMSVVKMLHSGIITYKHYSASSDLVTKQAVIHYLKALNSPTKLINDNAPVNHITDRLKCLVHEKSDRTRRSGFSSGKVPVGIEDMYRLAINCPAATALVPDLGLLFTRGNET